MQYLNTLKVECLRAYPFVAFPPMDYAAESGKRLKSAREAKRLLLRDLSAKVNGVLSVSRLSNYEQGIRQLGPEEAMILYRHLGVSPSYLLCVDVEGDMTKQEEELLRNYRALPERDRNDYSRRIEVSGPRLPRPRSRRAPELPMALPYQAQEVEHQRLAPANL